MILSNQTLVPLFNNCELSNFSSSKPLLLAVKFLSGELLIEAPPPPIKKS